MLPWEFLNSTKGYARSIVKVISIEVFGAAVPVTAVMVTGGLARSIAEGIRRLPDPIKAALLVGAVAALLHPKSRAWLTDRAVELGEVLAATSSALVEAFNTYAALHHESRVAADRHLESALSMIRSSPFPRTQRRRIRGHAGSMVEAGRSEPRKLRSAAR